MERPIKPDTAQFYSGEGDAMIFNQNAYMGAIGRYYDDLEKYADFAHSVLSSLQKAARDKKQAERVEMIVKGLFING